MKFLVLLVFGSFLSLTPLVAQVVNQVDANGERDGLGKSSTKVQVNCAMQEPSNMVRRLELLSFTVKNVKQFLL